MLRLLTTLLLAGSPTSSSTAAQVPTEVPVRAQRPLAVSVSPDLVMLHAQQHGDAVATIIAARISLNLTSRVALTAAFGWTPNLLGVTEGGLNVAVLESAFTPQVGVAVGSLNSASGDGSGTSSRFVMATAGIGYAARGGFEIAAEVGVGAAGGEVGPLLLRAGLRLGFRFDAGP